MKPAVLLLGAVAALGAAVLGLMFAGDGSPPPGTLPSSGATVVSGPAETLVAATSSDGAVPSMRAEVESDAVEIDDGAPDAELQLEGRVVDPTGAPVAGAAIDLYVRRERGFGRPGRGGGGPRGGRQRAAAQTKTDAEGQFTLRAGAYESTAFELAVAHADFAPQLVRRSWQPEDGQDKLEDIVLAVGATVAGVVIDDSQRPVPDAEVRYQRDGFRGFRGRRGRGGRDRGPSLEQMVAAVKSDANGHFEFRHLPPGRFSLEASAPRYLPGTTARIELAEDQQLDDQNIEVALGAELWGVVLDPQGKPIAGAEVECRPTRRFDPGAGDNQGGRGGRRGGRDPMAFFGGGNDTRRVETDAKGEFYFDAVAPKGVRLTASHPKFIEQQLDDVVPSRTNRVELRMSPRVAVTGIVVDAATGKPVELYGIEAREADRGFRGFGGRSGRGNRGDRGGPPPAAGSGGETDPRRAQFEAMRAEFERRATERQAYLAQRLGPSGEAPRRNPKPEKHAAGAFRIEDLEPGRYVFDINAPGYVAIAAGVVEIQRDQLPAPVTFQIQGGPTVAGHVVDATTNKPLAGARVELVVPPLEQSSSGGPGRGPGGPPGFGRRGRDVTVGSAKSARDGTFDLGPQRPGQYQVRVDARGYPEFECEVLVGSDRTSDALLLAVGGGARVFGQVVGLEVGHEATVVLTHTQGARHTARVDPETGTYEIKGLPEGGYVVRVEVQQEDGRDWRSRIGDFVAARTGQPDLVLSDGDEVRYDPTVGESHLARVVGTVTLNYEPATGVEVRLVPQSTGDPQGGPPGPFGRFGGRGRGGRGGGFLRDRPDDNGAFEISMVPPGSYALEVSARGRRGDNGPALHRELFTLVAGDEIHRDLSLVSGHLRLRVTYADNGEPVARAQVALVDAGEAAGVADPAQWSSLPSFRELRIRDGDVDLSDARVGSYRYAVQARDIVTQPGQLEVVAGDGPVVPIAVPRVPGMAPSGGTADFMQRLDGNGDGVLTPEELQGRAQRLMRADADGNGQVTPEELEAMRAARNGRGGQNGGNGPGGGGPGGGRSNGRGGQNRKRGGQSRNRAGRGRGG